MPETLIERLRRRIESGVAIDMHDLADVRPNPPVSEAEITAAEAQLGFTLPPLVRDLYTQLADGGYGPGYGMDRLAEVVQRGKEFATDGADAPWPGKFLHLCWWGCEYFSGLDCSRPDGRVLRYVPDEDDNPEPLRCEAQSLTEWLDAWLRGERLWDRVRLQFDELDNRPGT